MSSNKDLKEVIARWLMVRDGYNDDWYFDNCRDEPDKKDSYGVSLNQYLSEASLFIKENLQGYGKMVKPDCKYVAGLRVHLDPVFEPIKIGDKNNVNT